MKNKKERIFILYEKRVNANQHMFLEISSSDFYFWNNNILNMCGTCCQYDTLTLCMFVTAAA